MNEKKMSFWGGFNSAVAQLQEAEKQLNRLYEDGEIRLRVDEIELIDKKFEEVHEAERKITRVRNKFAKIANGKGVPVLAEV